MKPILILGGSGFIGHTLYKELAPFFEVKATYYTAKGFRKNQNFYPLDLENEELSALLREVKPKLIISALRSDFDT